eukprot:63941_1
MASPSDTFALGFTISFWLLCWCLLTPLLFYHLYRFYTLKESAIIHKRHYRIVIVINIIISVYLTVSRPCFILAVMEGSTGPNHNCLKALHDANTFEECSILQTIADLTDSATNHGWTTLLLMRMWLIFFETAYNQEVTKDDHKWTQFIQIHTQSAHKPWTQNVRHTLGNEYWILTRLWIPYYIFMICFSLFSLVIHTTFNYYPLLYIPIFIGFGYLWSKTSDSSDVLKVRHEMRLILRCAAFGLLIWMLYSVLLSHAHLQSYRVYIIYTFETFFAAWTTVYALCTTKWVISYSGLDSSKSKKQKRQSNPLTDILATTTTLHVFMKHLCNEWSMESLLCVIECYQFKQFIKNKSNPITFGNKTLLKHVILDTATLPQSSIVFDTELCATDKMKQLVDKYIRVDSRFQVNIGHHCRENLVSMCDQAKGMTDVDLYQCFDEVMSELMDLMYDSYYRFVNVGGLCPLNASYDQQVGSRSPSPSPSPRSLPLEI